MQCRHIRGPHPLGVKRPSGTPRSISCGRSLLLSSTPTNLLVAGLVLLARRDAFQGQHACDQYAWGTTHAYVPLWHFPHGVWGCWRARTHPDRSVANPTTAAFGERVRSRRLELGPSQEATAPRFGIHWTQSGQAERSQRSLRLGTIIRIADGLIVDAGQLVSGLPVQP